jgi:hypothetical protein
MGLVRQRVLSFHSVALALRPRQRQGPDAEFSTELAQEFGRQGHNRIQGINQLPLHSGSGHELCDA